jgi:aspartate/methionine/tyrosine aminotransferase
MGRWDRLAERDGGVPASPEHIFLTGGASEAVKMVMNLLIRDAHTGVRRPPYNTFSNHGTEIHTQR